MTGPVSRTYTMPNGDKIIGLRPDIMDAALNRGTEKPEANVTEIKWYCGLAVREPAYELWNRKRLAETPFWDEPGFRADLNHEFDHDEAVCRRIDALLWWGQS